MTKEIEKLGPAIQRLKLNIQNTVQLEVREFFDSTGITPDIEIKNISMVVMGKKDPVFVGSTVTIKIEY